MSSKHFGTIQDYEGALRALESEGNIPPKHRALLEAHFGAPRHAATTRELALAVGYKTFGGTNLQYGTLAHRVGTKLGVQIPPRGFWLFVLVDWDLASSQPNSDTRFVMRPRLVAALRSLGWVES